MASDADSSPAQIARIGRSDGWFGRLSPAERHVWILALATLVADVGLTRYGLANGLTEANPFGAGAFDALGIAGLVLLKFGALGVAVAGRQALPERYTVVPPAVLACVWGGAVVVNATLILVAT